MPEATKISTVLYLDRQDTQILLRVLESAKECYDAPSELYRFLQNHAHECPGIKAMAEKMGIEINEYAAHYDDGNGGGKW